MHKYIRALKKARLKSNCKIKMSAIAVKGGKIIASACNTDGSAKRGTYQYSRHAEASLLQTLLWKAHDTRVTTVLVYREHGGSGKWLQSKPCRLCRRELAKANIKEVLYVTEEGWKKLKFD